MPTWKATLRKFAMETVETELAKETLTVAGWRKVPVNSDVLGRIARESLPDIYQVLINAPFGWGAKDLERRLFMTRRRVEKKMVHDPDFYVVSFSAIWPTTGS